MFCHEIEIWSKINEKENIFQAEEDFDKLQMSVITTIPESFTRQALFNDVKGISPQNRYRRVNLKDIKWRLIQPGNDLCN